jgi:hypothetical protein
MQSNTPPPQDVRRPWSNRLTRLVAAIHCKVIADAALDVVGQYMLVIAVGWMAGFAYSLHVPWELIPKAARSLPKLPTAVWFIASNWQQTDKLRSREKKWEWERESERESESIGMTRRRWGNICQSAPAAAEEKQGGQILAKLVLNSVHWVDGEVGCIAWRCRL